MYFNYFLVILSLLLINKVTAEFTILHHPSAIDFRGNEKLNANSISSVCLASLGNSIDDDSNWSGLYVIQPFNLPQKVVNVVIDGVNKIHLNDKSSKSYELDGNTRDVHESLNTLSTMLEESKVIDVDLNQGIDGLETYSDVLGDITIPIITKSSTNNLKPNIHSEDKLFLQQISIINALAEKVLLYSKTNNLPKLITIRMSLQSLANAHGKDSPAFIEAKKMLSNATEKFMLACREAYKDDVLINVITNEDDEYSRVKRQAAGTDTNNKSVDPSKLNLATHYSDDYPVIFNIILWFGVIMAFSLLAISYTIATMDPGRDSIIYRMTSTRMKKDN